MEVQQAPPVPEASEPLPLAQEPAHQVRWFEIPPIDQDPIWKEVEQQEQPAPIPVPAAGANENPFSELENEGADLLSQIFAEQHMRVPSACKLHHLVDLLEQEHNSLQVIREDWFYIIGFTFFMICMIV